MNSSRPDSAPRRRTAFTLIELLVVVAVVGTLVAIAIPAVGGVRRSAATAQALANVRQIGMANLLYARDNQGRLLGEGWTWADTNDLWNNTVRYIGENPGNTDTDKTRLNAVLGNLVDPLVPERFHRFGAIPADSLLITWSANTILNVKNGRVSQGIPETLPASVAPTYIRRRNLSEFAAPDRVVYMVSGSYQFDTNIAADAALLNEPTSRQRIFYYHRNGHGTPAVFLDGHSDILAYPIAPKLINPSL